MDRDDGQVRESGTAPVAGSALAVALRRGPARGIRLLSYALAVLNLMALIGHFI